MNAEIIDMAGGDTYRARAVHQLLTRLAGGPNPILREMASGVLKGEISLRDAAATDTYSDVIAERFETFWQRYQQLTPDEHQALLADGQRFIEQPETYTSDEATSRARLSARPETGSGSMIAGESAAHDDDH